MLAEKIDVKSLIDDLDDVEFGHQLAPFRQAVRKVEDPDERLLLQGYIDDAQARVNAAGKGNGRSRRDERPYVPVPRPTFLPRTQAYVPTRTEPISTPGSRLWQEVMSNLADIKSANSQELLTSDEKAILGKIEDKVDFVRHHKGTAPGDDALRAALGMMSPILNRLRQARIERRDDNLKTRKEIFKKEQPVGPSPGADKYGKGKKGKQQMGAEQAAKAVAEKKGAKTGKKR